MKTILITGGIGSGKSKILSFFSKKGYPCYDSDLNAKKILNSNQVIKNSIKKNFGNLSYKNGKLNPKYLSDVVFNNPNKLKKLNSIIHPEVQEDFKKFTNNINKPFVFMESAIFFESKSNFQFDYCILVTAPIEIRVKRTLKRDFTTTSQIMLRVSQQWSDQKKIEYSDKVIENINWNKTVLSLEKLLIDLKIRFNVTD